MGKMLVVICAALFVCGVVGSKCGESHQVAMGNSHGVTWLLIGFVGVILVGYKLVSK